MRKENEKLLGRIVPPQSKDNSPKYIEEKLLGAMKSMPRTKKSLSRAGPQPSVPKSPKIWNEMLTGRAAPQPSKAVPSSTATPSNTDLESKCSTAKKSLILNNMSKKLLMSGTQEEEHRRKCILSKSEDLECQVIEPTSSSDLSLKSQKTVMTKNNISSKILEMRKLWEGNISSSIFENNLSERNSKPNCDRPMGMEIEESKVCRPTALGEGD